MKLVSGFRGFGLFGVQEDIGVQDLYRLGGFVKGPLLAGS